MATETESGVTYDVAVIGAGVAGLTAARRSQQLGGSVVLIEKAVEGQANATRRSGGAFHAAYYDPRTHGPDEMYAAVMRFTEGHARPDTARAWADNVLRALLFLESEGGTFERRDGDEGHWNVSGPAPRVEEHMTEREARWKGAANDRLLNRMTRSFMDAGGTYRPGTRARSLETDGAAVVGVQVEPTAGGRRELLHARAVIMCDGGFTGNPELVRRYVTKHNYIIRCSDLATGDCLEMATAIGAQAVELDAAYQMVALRDRLTNPATPFPPSPTWLMRAAMIVNGNGERLGDEAAETPDMGQGAGTYPSNQWADKRLSGAMARTDAPGDSWVVFDDEIWDTVGRQTTGRAESSPRSDRLKGTPLNPAIVEHGGTLLSAGTIADLAKQAEIPADRLQKSVDAFNRFCRDGVPLDPPRSARAKPIARAPFHAIPLVPGFFFMMGGVLVNGNGQVLDQQERPIPGLYAAGGAMGGLMGGPRDGYAGGWAEASTFGILGAEHALRAAPVGAGR